MRMSSWRVRAKLSSKPSGVWGSQGLVRASWPAWTKWKAWKWKEQTCAGDQPGKWLWPQGAVCGLTQILLLLLTLGAFSSEKRRCVPSSGVITQYSLEESGKVPQGSLRHQWESGEGVVFKWSRRLASGSTREAPFWLLNETLNKRTCSFKNLQRTRGPDQCVSNCRLDSLMSHTIYWVVWIRAILTDAMNDPRMWIRSLFTSVNKVTLAQSDIYHFCSHSTGETSHIALAECRGFWDMWSLAGQLFSRNSSELWEESMNLLAHSQPLLPGGHAHTHAQSNTYDKYEYTIFYIKSFNKKVHREMQRWR